MFSCCFKIENLVCQAILLGLLLIKKRNLHLRTPHTLLMHAVPLGWYTISADRIFYFETAPQLLIQTFVGGMLSIYWVESGAPPVGFYNARLLSPVKAARKSLPTGLATTYRGAHASEHYTESMRKAVFLTPCEIPGEMAQKKKYARCCLLFLVSCIFFLYPCRGDRLVRPCHAAGGQPAPGGCGAL